MALQFGNYVPGGSSYRRQNEYISNMGRFSERPKIPEYPKQQAPVSKNTSVAGNYNVGSDQLTRLMNAISGQESGGNYSATNPSGALGKYQIMNFNLANWARDAGLGYTPSRQQFLNDPQMQELIARTQFQNALNRYGDLGQVAAWWYGGEGGRKAYVSGGGRNKEAGGYPSIQEYVRAVLARMGT